MSISRLRADLFRGTDHRARVAERHSQTAARRIPLAMQCEATKRTVAEPGSSPRGRWIEPVRASTTNELERMGKDKGLVQDPRSQTSGVTLSRGMSA